MTIFRCWSPDVVSILMTTGRKRWMIVGVYIPPTNKKEIYEETLEGILQAAAVAQGENAELIILGDINVDLRGITNPRMELLQGDYEGQDERRAATISTLSSLGLEDTGKRFLQRKNVGIWTWSQVQQGARVRSVCDYILTSPFVRVLTHRIRRVPGCSTDHRLVYVDIPHGGIETQKKRKWGLQRWPVPKAPPSKLNRTFEAIRKAVPQEETKRSNHDDWISTQTWRSLHEKASLRWRTQLPFALQHGKTTDAAPPTNRPQPTYGGHAIKGGSPRRERPQEIISAPCLVVQAKRRSQPPSSALRNGRTRRRIWQPIPGSPHH